MWNLWGIVAERHLAAELVVTWRLEKAGQMVLVGGGGGRKGAALTRHTSGRHRRRLLLARTRFHHVHQVEWSLSCVDSKWPRFWSRASLQLGLYVASEQVYDSPGTDECSLAVLVRSSSKLSTTGTKS